MKLISPVNWLEAAIRAEHAGPADIAALDAFVVAAEIDIVPVDQFQMRIAHMAWRDFGKGHHPASLNLGDCFAYALAKQTGQPLLFKGRDFGRTDVKSVL